MLLPAPRAPARPEERAAHRVLGQVHEAMGNRAEAEAAFRRSLDVLEEIQSLPELAQTLLGYGSLRRRDNALEDRAMIQRALSLFYEMSATGWIAEARAVLGSRQPHNQYGCARTPPSPDCASSRICRGCAGQARA
jgi:tetratricopeptide (TPR) repeat protein